MGAAKSEAIIAKRSCGASDGLGGIMVKTNYSQLMQEDQMVSLLLSRSHAHESHTCIENCNVDVSAGHPPSVPVSLL